MEDAPLPEPLPAPTASDRLAEAVDLDRAGSALDMRRARLLAVLKRMDLAKLGYGTFRAFCAEHVEAGDTRIRQLITLAECPFARVRAAVVAGRLAPSVAARGIRDIDPEGEEAWLESAIAGEFRRKRREPDLEVEFTREDARDIANARTLARLNLGQPVSEAVADRHILGAWRRQDAREKLLKDAHTPPPAPAPLPAWTEVGTEPDPADTFVGPWQDPEDAGHAVALLRLVSAMRTDRVRQLGLVLATIAQERDYAAQGFHSFESWVRSTLSVDIRTVQRYRKALEEEPGLELLRAWFVQDVATDDTRDAWREIAPRVPMAELERVRVLARQGAEQVLREAYLRAIATLDAEQAAAGNAELAAAGIANLGGATRGARPSLVSLAATLPPPPAPRAVVAHPDLPEAARWYLHNGRPPRERGIGLIRPRDAYTCVNPECAARSLRVHVHHRTPRSKGGTDASDNLDLLCAACHLRLRHSGHLSVERTHLVNGADRLVFTFVDRTITMFGYPGIA